MKSGTIGVQMYNLKSKVETNGAYATLQKISELGFKGVEVTQIAMSAENVSELRRASQDFGIKIVSVTAPLDRAPGQSNESLVTDFDKIVADCKTLDCNFIRIGMMPVTLMGQKDKAMEYIDQAEEMAHRLSEHGIELYYHNHHIEFEKYDGVTLLDIMRERTTKLGFELDVYWIQRGGEDPESVIRRFEGRVSIIHLKDYRIGRLDLDEEDFKDQAKFHSKFQDIIQFAELGQGTLNIAGIIETGMKSGVQYFLIEQDNTYGRDPFDCLTDSRDYLQSIGYGPMI